MSGVAMTTSVEVAKFAQTSSGIRQNVIPGARMVMIVTRKLSAVMIDDAPDHWTPMLKKNAPSSAREAQREPKPGAKKLESIITPAIGSSQNESAFSRGNAMSGAPIISGIT